MPLFNPHRCDHLSEAQILGQIGALLATAVIRHAQPRAQRIPSPAHPTALSDFLKDPVEQEVVRLLTRRGAATAREIQTELGVSRGVLAGRLRHLRVSGLCVMFGRTRTTHYRLREEFSGN
ncbi:MAG: hypothetical protein PSW75_08700 [bacterium]|nr:hypothetical protein [bacterium]